MRSTWGKWRTDMTVSTCRRSGTSRVISTFMTWRSMPTDAWCSSTRCSAAWRRSVSGTVLSHCGWKPPFLSKLAAEDRCHLNGLAMESGRAAYVTSVSQNDVTDGWRARRRDGGCVIDVRTNETLVSGGSMPHSPRVWCCQAYDARRHWVSRRMRFDEPSRSGRHPLGNETSTMGALARRSDETGKSAHPPGALTASARQESER